jgi:hypothetical protein
MATQMPSPEDFNATAPDNAITDVYHPESDMPVPFNLLEQY